MPSVIAVVFQAAGGADRRPDEMPSLEYSYVSVALSMPEA